MYRDDPLEGWLYYDSVRVRPKVIEQRRAEAHAGLNELSDFLDNPPPKRADMGNVSLPGRWNVGGLPPGDLTRAQELYRRVFDRGGTGNTIIQEELLYLIANSRDPTSIPFWIEMLQLSKPRDRFARRRRTMALAALARLAIGLDVPEAYEALRAVAHDDRRPDVRALAIHYWGRAYLDAERPLPPEVVDELSDIAVNDRAFGPRFQARAQLQDADLPIPLDNPGGVYAFKVKLMWAKHIYRTIELRSEQTLDDLHFAIQRAIHWDADHLYSFYMNGVLYDDRYAFACPFEDDRPPWTDEAVVGELGLVKKHKFLYFFDYGDSHKFEVEVVDIRPEAEPGEYPRLVDSRGEAPPQYGW